MASARWMSSRSGRTAKVAADAVDATTRRLRTARKNLGLAINSAFFGCIFCAELFGMMISRHRQPGDFYETNDIPPRDADAVRRRDVRAAGMSVRADRARVGG